MAATLQLGPNTPGDTEILGLAALVAIALHVLVITQINFGGGEAVPAEQAPNLDVILVDWASEQAPEQADFLAQSNQIGGGDNTETERPTAPPAVSPPMAEVDPVPEPPQPAAAQPEPQPLDPLVTTTALHGPVLDPVDPVLDELPDDMPDARELMQQTRSLAQLSTDPLADRRVTPRRPKRKFVTANTQEHLYASYMRSWVAKVERVGNMNYPEEARRQNLEGSLVLSVDVMADGSIEHIRLLRSSGFDLLDEAAIRIVRLSAPFAELPPDIRAETDILTIIRTWQFSAQGLTN
ncbi:MAG: TonB family protein [Pseudomonadota bacterium]